MLRRCGSNPIYAEAHNNLGVALASQGRISEAIAEYREALRLKPDLAPALYELAWILATMGTRTCATPVRPFS